MLRQQLVDAFGVMRLEAGIQEIGHAGLHQPVRVFERLEPAPQRRLLPGQLPQPDREEGIVGGPPRTRVFGDLQRDRVQRAHADPGHGAEAIHQRCTDVLAQASRGHGDPNRQAHLGRITPSLLDEGCDRIQEMGLGDARARQDPQQMDGGIGGIGGHRAEE